MKGLRCRYCQQVFQSSAYHPQQTVCNQPACQHQRQRDYHRRKIATDPVYRQVCLESPRKWRLAHPDYWKQYRQSHPQQVERNRRQQRLRDRKRQLGNLANNRVESRGPGAENKTVTGTTFMRFRGPGALDDNLASRKILSFQAPSHPEPDSSPSCKQHPSSTAALAGL
jgi:hypothetical protein